MRGDTQRVIGEYEAGRRQPSLPTLARLVAATGHELTVCVRILRMRVDLAPASGLEPRVRAQALTDAITR